MLLEVLEGDAGAESVEAFGLDDEMDVIRLGQGRVLRGAWRAARFVHRVGTMNFARSSVSVFAVTFVSTITLVAGCHVQEPGSPTPGLTKPIDPPKPPDLGRGAPRGSAEVSYNIWLGSVQDVCQGPSPFFEFDSSKADASEQPTMQTLATCMVNGPLKGKSIRLVGHTDPRGSAEYNQRLGLERAQRVKRYLVAHGVDAVRVDAESAGEEEASKAPASWPKDRRVEVRLVADKDANAKAK